MTTIPSSAPRKIAVVVPKYGLAGGAEQFAASLTERLAGSTPYEFHVFAHRWRIQPGSPVLFHRLPEWRWPRFLRPWAFAKAVERALRTDHFDLVHSHDRIFRADVFSLHCTPHRTWVRDVRAKIPSLFDRVMIGVERRMVSGNPSATFLPVSSLSADLFHREYPDAKGHWKIMPPGVDYARFSGPDRDTCRREICARHGIDRGAFVVLFVGMNFEHKGLDTVMEAVAKASRQRIVAKFHLLVVGKGNIGKYRTQAARLGLASSVTFAGAITSDLERYYRAADCLMLLSAFDTFGMVVLEALAADLPVIISAEVGARDVVEDEHDGFIVQDREDAHAVARALIAIASVERRSAGTKSSFAKVRQHDWSARAEEIGLIYDSLMNPTGRDG
jgi:UDP-glucose:(heptosyl)LPS alpha-1,3-glucosyltransferase